jgi:hypothetical protein
VRALGSGPAGKLLGRSANAAAAATASAAPTSASFVAVPLFFCAESATEMDWARPVSLPAVRRVAPAGRSDAARAIALGSSPCAGALLGTAAGARLEVSPSTRSMRSTEIREVTGAQSSSCRASTATFGIRRSRSRCRHCSTVFARLGGISGRSLRTSGGASPRMRLASSGIVVAVNGIVPVRNSYRMTPSAQTSARTSTAPAASSCSGALYTGEPTNAWV